MTSCHSCGKLIASGTGEQMCRACRMAAREATQPPAAVPEPASGAPSPAPEPEVDLCVRCRSHPALADSDFCLACNLELVAALGDAAEEVFRHPPAPPEPPVASPASLMSDLEDKRDRTATSHMRVVGGVRIK